MADPNYPKFVALEQPGVAAIWHDWYKQNPDGAASLEEKIAVQDGKAPLPPGSRLWLDCNPTFDPAITSGKREDAGPNFVPWPNWLCELLSEAGDVVQSATLGGNTITETDWIKIQAPDAVGGKNQNSLGYAPIFYVFPTNFPAKLRFTVQAAGLSSPPLLFPWVSQK